MKKILTILLSVCLILNICSAVSFAEDDMKLSDAGSEALRVIKALGFISEEYDESYVAEAGGVSKAQFAKFIKGIASPETRGSGKLYYHDVPSSHYAFEEITVLTDLGIISNNSEQYFRPDDVIQREEAARILLGMIGCGELAEIQGVRKLAVKLHLYDGTSMQDEVSFSDMIIMTYNALLTETLDMTGVHGNEGVIYEAQGQTYLSKNFDVYVGKGIVNGYDGISVYGDEVNEDEVLVGDKTFKNSGLNLYDYLGYEVEYMYHADEAEDENVLLWINATKKNKELYLNKITDDFRFDADTYTLEYCTNSDKLITRKLGGNLNVVYNGEYVENNVFEALEGDIFSVKLIENDGRGYSVAIVEDYENYLFVSGSEERETISVKNCDNSWDGTYKNENIYLAEYGQYEIMLDGKEIEISKIPSNAILSVLAAPGKSRITINCSIATVNGAVSEMEETNEYTTFIIDGKEYKTYMNGLNLSVTYGNPMLFRLDKYGYIAYAEAQRGEVSFGYYLMKGTFAGSFGDKTIKIKMYNEEGKILDYVIAEKLTIDGKLYKDVSKNATEVFANLPARPTLIAYTLNENGEVRKIDTPASASDTTPKTTDNMLVELIPYKSVPYTMSNKKLGPMVRVSDKTRAFGVPSVIDELNEKDFTVGNGSIFANETTYVAAVYNYGSSINEFADVVVCQDVLLGVPGWLSTHVLVEKVSQVVNSEGEAVYKIRGYHGNNKTDLLLSETGSENVDIHPGDMIAMDGYRGTEFDGYVIQYRPGSGTRPVDKSFAIGGPRITMVYVHDIIGNTMLCGFDSGETYEEVFALDGVKILVYDSAREEVREGSIADLETYKSVGDNCSDVYIYTVNTEIRNFVIYK